MNGLAARSQTPDLEIIFHQRAELFKNLRRPRLSNGRRPGDRFAAHRTRNLLGNRPGQTAHDESIAHKGQSLPGGHPSEELGDPWGQVIKVELLHRTSV